MKRRHFVAGVLHAGLFSTAKIGSAERQPHVVFLNPGEHVERGTGPYWRMVTQFMRPAARSLGVHLEVLYAERDHLLMLRQADDVARRSPAPDIGITGDPNTLASMERANGVKDYVAHAGRGRIHQLAFGDWSYADGERKAAVLLARYPDANIIWAANDSMALGALRAVRARQADVLVGGMAGFPDAIASVAEGALRRRRRAGGYLICAPAIVMLYGYHRGVDSAAHGGLAQKFDHMYVVHRENVSRFNDVALKRSESLDFRGYSKALNPGPGPYDFRLTRLVGRGKV